VVDSLRSVAERFAPKPRLRFLKVGSGECWRELPKAFPSSTS
jgi:hypothetical protein